MKKCINSIGEGSFIDGLALGVLLKSDIGTTDAMIDMFSEWRDSARDMEVVQEEKKMYMYIAYLMTYTKGRHFTHYESTSNDDCLRRREEKLQRKLEEDHGGISYANDEIKNLKVTTEENTGLKSPETVSIWNQQDYINQQKNANDKESEFDFNSEDKFSCISEKQIETAKEEDTKASEEAKENSKICSICNQEAKDFLLMNQWEHPYHPKCLKEKVIEQIIWGSYKIRCSNKNWTQVIERDTIVPLISDDARICFDTLQFMNDFNMIGGEKTLYWCHKCRYISIRYPTQSSSCTRCKKKMDKLKNVLTLSKLLLSSEKPQAKDKTNYEMIGFCLTDCDSQIKKWDVCKLWKHKFTSVSMKCLCLNN